MSTFFKLLCLALLSVILGLVIGKQWKEAGILLMLCSCCAVLAGTVMFLEPVIALIEQLQEQAGLDSDMLKILLKVTGIALLSQLASLICSDAGNAGMGKAVQFLSSAVILWLAVPLFTQLLQLVTNILGEV